MASSRSVDELGDLLRGVSLSDGPPVSIDGKRDRAGNDLDPYDVHLPQTDPSSIPGMRADQMFQRIYGWAVQGRLMDDAGRFTLARCIELFKQDTGIPSTFEVPGLTDTLLDALARAIQAGMLSITTLDEINSNGYWVYAYRFAGETLQFIASDDPQKRARYRPLLDMKRPPPHEIEDELRQTRRVRVAVSANTIVVGAPSVFGGLSTADLLREVSIGVTARGARRARRSTARPTPSATAPENLDKFYSNKEHATIMKNLFMKYFEDTTQVVWEPCYGSGNLVAKVEQLTKVIGSDIKVDQGKRRTVEQADMFEDVPSGVKTAIRKGQKVLIITNPPYNSPNREQTKTKDGGLGFDKGSPKHATYVMERLLGKRYPKKQGIEYIPDESFGGLMLLVPPSWHTKSRALTMPWMPRYVLPLPESRFEGPDGSTDILDTCIMIWFPEDRNDFKFSPRNPKYQMKTGITVSDTPIPNNQIAAFVRYNAFEGHERDVIFPDSPFFPELAQYFYSWALLKQKLQRDTTQYKKLHPRKTDNEVKRHFQSDIARVTAAYNMVPTGGEATGVKGEHAIKTGMYRAVRVTSNESYWKDKLNERLRPPNMRMEYAASLKSLSTSQNKGVTNTGLQLQTWLVGSWVPPWEELKASDYLSEGEFSITTA